MAWARLESMRYRDLLLSLLLELFSMALAAEEVFLSINDGFVSG